MKKKLVYIAGKLKAPTPSEYLKNVNAMITRAEVVRSCGFNIFTPCNDMLNGILCGRLEPEDYIENDLAILERCDAVMLCEGYETSHGVSLEIDKANERGIPVFETTNELVWWAQDESKR